MPALSNNRDDQSNMKQKIGSCQPKSEKKLQDQVEKNQNYAN